MAISFSMYTPDPEGWLDVPGSSLESGIQIQAYPAFHGGANQQWNLIPAPLTGGDNKQYFQIESMASNLLLTLDGGRTDERTPVIQLEDVGDDQQLWMFNPNLEAAWVSGISYFIVPKSLAGIWNVGGLRPGPGGKAEISRTPGGTGSFLGTWIVQACNFAGTPVPSVQPGQGD